MRKESDSGVFNCIICKEDRDYLSVGSCYHRGVCIYCSLRSRILYNDKKCPICATKLDYVFVMGVEDRSPITELENNKDYFYKDDEFNDNGIYFVTVSAKEEALNLKSFICPIRACQDSAFDNLQTLCTHLNKVHKRYYCDTCIKEGKQFLSEMKIYNYDSLAEHVNYGEYTDKGILFIPPHPFCFFCNMKFYNDEILFKHMNECHFICQLCRDKKNIIFYKEISHLVEHNKFEHYACPYQECIEDLFVVFDSEEKLNSHLITKHRCTDAKNRIANFMFDNSSNTGKKNTNYERPRDEAFNFTKYINDLKEKIKSYSNNFIQHTNTFIGSKEEVKYYKDNHRVHNQNTGYGNIPVLKNEDNNKYSKKIKSSGDYFTTAIQQDNHYNNSYNANNQSYDNNHYGNYGEPSNDKHRGKPRRGDKQSHFKENNRRDQISQSETLYKQEIKIDYSFVFNAMFKQIKEYIIERTKSEAIKEEEFILPHETTYQLIIIIDKLDNQKLYELNSLANFGIDIDLVKEIRNILVEAAFRKDKIAAVLNSLQIKKILIIYKYFSIASNKLDGLFYKLEIEQIESDLYDDFATRKKPKRAKQVYTNKTEAVKIQPMMYAKKNKKYLMSEDNFPVLVSKQVDTAKHKGNSKLKGLLNEKTEKAASNSEIIQETKVFKQETKITNQEIKMPKQEIKMPKQETKIMKQETKITNQETKIENSSSTIKREGKLTNLLSEQLTIKPSPKVDIFKKSINKNKIDYEEEFPEL